MTGEPTTLAVVLVALEDALTQRGLDFVGLARDAGLEPDLLRDPKARCPARPMNRLWELIAAATGDPCIGLEVARHVRPSMFGAIGIGVLHSRTLLDALHRMSRYFAVLSTNSAIELHETPTTTRLVATAHPSGATATPYARDALSVAALELLRLLAGSTLRPVLVTTEHGDYGQRERYEAAYGCPVEFDAAEGAMHFDTAVVGNQLATTDPEIAAQADRLAERYLERLEPELASAKVRSLLLELLPAGELSQERVARNLHQSASTLQRRLRQEGTSYQALLDETRRWMAEAYLQDGRYSLAEIAFLLGFADQSNFTRAFKRWTGRTPGSYLDSRSA
ncbi:MAG TPA: AraC family transcriptional regulator [Steroidobacteraceae bacterium]|nr:AraC family transcriptional regulator [Steroidobacteraceae bacterium]